MMERHTSLHVDRSTLSRVRGRAADYSPRHSTHIVVTISADAVTSHLPETVYRLAMLFSFQTLQPAGSWTRPKPIIPPCQGHC
jgi:hypothetical protein